MAPVKPVPDENIWNLAAYRRTLSARSQGAQKKLRTERFNLLSPQDFSRNLFKENTVLRHLDPDGAQCIQSGRF